MRTAEDYVQVRCLSQTFHCRRLKTLQRTTCKVAGQETRCRTRRPGEKVGEMARRREEGAFDEGKLPWRRGELEEEEEKGKRSLKARS
jgi:hypothetical protein